MKMSRNRHTINKLSRDFKKCILVILKVGSADQHGKQHAFTFRLVESAGS